MNELQKQIANELNQNVTGTLDQPVLESNDQQQILLQEFFPNQPTPISEPGSGAYAEPQKLRTLLGQGVALGFGDEIEAFARSLLDDNVSYEQIRDEIRKKVTDYAVQNPSEAAMLEITGAIAPSVALVFGNPLAAMNSIKNIFTTARTIFRQGSKSSSGSIAQTANRAGLEGGVYAVGKQDEDLGLKNAVSDFGGGYAFSAPTAGAFALTGQGASSLYNAMMKKLKKDKLADPVLAELQEMARKTGMTPEEIVERVARGEIMSENATLLAYIKKTLSDSGKPQKDFMDTVGSRPAKTRRDLKEAMEENLSIAKGVKDEESLITIYNQSQDEIKEFESKLYKNVFSNKDEVSYGVLGAMDKAMRNVPDFMETLNTKYNLEDSLVPLLKRENGVLKMVRVPTIEDAEITRRLLQKVVKKAFNDGNPNATALAKVHTDLKNQLDISSEDLRLVRDNAHNIRQSREGYQLGNKLLGGSQDAKPDAVKEFIRLHGDKPGVMESLQIGFTQALRNADNNTPINNLARDDSNLRQIASLLFPEDVLENLIEKAQIAAKSQRVISKYPEDAGSITQPLQAAEASTGVAASVARGDVAGAAAQSTNYIVRMLKNRGLQSQEIDKIVEVLVTENPDVVQKALIDDVSMNTLNRLIDSLLYNTGRITGTVTGASAGANLQEEKDPIGNSGVLDYIEVLGKHALNLMEQ